MISKDEKQLLDDMLKNSSPVLFLGAGFSIGSKNQNDNFDAQGLRGYIFNKLVIGKAEESDIEEIKQKTCLLKDKRRSLDGSSC